MGSELYCTVFKDDTLFNWHHFTGLLKGAGILDLEFYHMTLASDQHKDHIFGNIHYEYDEDLIYGSWLRAKPLLFTEKLI